MRAPLEHAPDGLCPRKMRRGQVKRCVLRGPLIGYYISCPGCGFCASYLDDAHGFVEEPAEPRIFPKRLVGARTSPRCIRCGAHLVIEGGTLEARPA